MPESSPAWPSVPPPAPEFPTAPEASCPSVPPSRCCTRQGHSSRGPHPVPYRQNLLGSHPRCAKKWEISMGPLQQSWGVWGEYPPHNQHSRTDSPITAEGASRAGPRGGTAPTTTVSPPRAAVGGVGGGPPTQSTQPDRQPGDRKGRQPARAQN